MYLSALGVLLEASERNFQNWITSSTGEPINESGGPCIVVGTLCEHIEKPQGMWVRGGKMGKALWRTRYLSTQAILPGGLEKICEFR